MDSFDFLPFAVVPMIIGAVAFMVYNVVAFVSLI